MEECTKDSHEMPNPRKSWKIDLIRISKYQMAITDCYIWDKTKGHYFHWDIHNLYSSDYYI